MRWKRPAGFGLRIMATAAIPVFLLGGAAIAQERPVATDTLDTVIVGIAPIFDGRDVPVSLIQAYADPFLSGQNQDGSYPLPANVQTHMKAVMGMVMASQVTGDIRYAESARRDLLWVIRNRMEPNGGINWTGPQNPYFFEVHQHWFLIASEMVRQAVGGTDSLRTFQRRAWLYLLQNNPASADFYYHNLSHHGAFFAYRSVDREGHFQSQAPFKGSYEVGAALWALALHRGHSWLDVGPGSTPGHTVDEYLSRLVTQTQLPPTQNGFFDGERGCWIRSILWNGVDWAGWELHDTKYALHTSEGALLYSILSGRGDLLDEERRDIENLLARVYPGGTIHGIPDGNGTSAYEYGQALSVLGLGAVAPWGPVPGVENRCLTAGREVLGYATRNFGPATTEDRALLLLGMCRVFQADQRAHTLASFDAATFGIRPTETVLSIWPNPMSERTSIHYALPPEEAGFLRIIDASGRELTSIAIDASAASGRWLWDGRDASGRHLPSGLYRAVLDDGHEHWSAGVSIVR